MSPTTTSGELRVDGLYVERGSRTVVHNASLTVPTGQVTALLGPNGAGKSSLVLGVGGVLRPRAGTVTLGGQDLTAKPPETVRKQGLAIVPEGRRLLRSMTVADNLRVATYTLPKAESAGGRDYVRELFPELERLLGRPAGMLSGGEQQMVVLAQALIARPKVVIVDELSLGLAPVVVKRLIPALESVAQSGVGVLLIEQFAHVALALAETAYVLVGGRILLHDTAAHLREDPSRLSSAYLLREVDNAPA
jgi:branched-chain amino acid transport system ATP-binding protein